MASITNPELTITTHPFENRATVVATCDVQFTEFEVNAMTLLQLRYTVDCQVLNKDLRYEDTVIRYDSQDLPRLTGPVATEQVVFETVAAMSDLHEHIITNDQLVAELTLTNQETGEYDSKRTEVVTVDLVG